MSETPSTPKSSIYCYLFNITRFSFPYREALTNFATFADEVVCSTIKDEDGSAGLLHALATELPNLRIVETEITTDDNRFDGKLKTEALKRTTHPIKIIADCDERFPLSNKPLWEERYTWLLAQPSHVHGLLIPVIDLWGSKENVRADKETGLKFRLHRDTVVSRGVIPQAELYNGLFDTKLSDSTEPLLANGQLANFASFMNRTDLMPMFVSMLHRFPYVIHEGYLDLEARAKLNAEFWKPKWEQRSGHEENVETELRKLKRVATVPHGLPLE